MQSSLIGKIEKARVYASEPHRMHVDHLKITFHGENSDHEVEIANGAWSCSCGFFASWRVCSHTMAIERIMNGMVPPLPLPQAESA